MRSDAPNRFGLIHNVAAAGGVVIVISPTKDPELILRSMRAGAREFVLESEITAGARFYEKLARAWEVLMTEETHGAALGSW